MQTNYNNKIIDDNTSEWVKKIGKPSLKGDITRLIEAIDKEADNYLNSHILYPVNGKYYKPKWADTAGTYWGLLQLDDTLISKGMPSTFPMIIKDATQLPENFVSMTRADLENLIAFLIQEIQRNYNVKTDLIGQLRTLEKALNECVERVDFDDIARVVNEMQIAYENRHAESEIPAEDEIIDTNVENDIIEENTESEQQ